MRLRGLVIGLALTAALAPTVGNSAFACSPFPSPSVYFFFDVGVSEVNHIHDSFEAMIKRAMPHGVSPKCYSSVEVQGHSDNADAMVSDVRIDLVRAEVVREALVRAGMPRESIKIDGRMVTLPMVATTAGGSALANRYVAVRWSQAWSAGRSHCDPTTLNDQSRSFEIHCGIPKYSACYWELADGTICNFHGVPDPNPSKYSVVGQ